MGKLIINSVIGLLCTALLGWGVWITNASYCSAKNGENVNKNKAHIERVDFDLRKEKAKRADDVKDLMKLQMDYNQQIMDKLIQIQKEIKK